MDTAQFIALVQKLGDQSPFIDGGQLRIQEKSVNLYELAYIFTDSCGGKIYHPRIMIDTSGEKIQPISLYDQFVTPIIQLTIHETGSWQPDEEQLVGTELTELLSLLYQAVQKK